MTIINAKPRFGLDSETGKLYDYTDKQYIDVGEFISSDGGVWDTAKVAALIADGKSIESAFCANSPPATGAEDDKVSQANADFANTPVGESAVITPAPVDVVADVAPVEVAEKEVSPAE